MDSTVHSIEHSLLKPHIQYILYNQSNGAPTESVTSYPNINICLGLINQGQLKPTNERVEGATYEGFSAYSTGLYDRPHSFLPSTHWDEICIDFHPSSYFHFFDIPSQPKLFDEALAQEMFNPTEQHLIEQLFLEKDLSKRSLLLEAVLVRKLHKFEQATLQLALHHIHLHEGQVKVKNLLQITQASERKLYRLFKDHFGIKPKVYIRIYKIRNALQMVLKYPQRSLTEVAYTCGYTDQSHFIKEAKTLCHLLPKYFRSQLNAVDDQVIVNA